MREYDEESSYTQQIAIRSIQKQILPEKNQILV